MFGHHVPAAAGVVEEAHRLEQVAAFLDPAACCERVAAHVEAHGHAVAVLGDHARRPLGVLERGGADVHARGAGFERRVE